MKGVNFNYEFIRVDFTNYLAKMRAKHFDRGENTASNKL